jgi:hypothetical protein
MFNNFKSMIADASTLVSTRLHSTEQLAFEARRQALAKKGNVKASMGPVAHAVDAVMVEILIATAHMELSASQKAFIAREVAAIRAGKYQRVSRQEFAVRFMADLRSLALSEGQRQFEAGVKTVKAEAPKAETTVEAPKAETVEAPVASAEKVAQAIDAIEARIHSIVDQVVGAELMNEIEGESLDEADEAEIIAWTEVLTSMKEEKNEGETAQTPSAGLRAFHESVVSMMDKS